ncbi:MAG TPA: hypothetical protein PKA33_04510 [Amaricoccus sp.]|jgi:hypothetical protein|uniref:hypothetical protein n=1 Tax=Amaricoccus sp. TaxID=1872485 RepID=UPI002BF0B0BA|nr:hypothetical protein [Amaricoccus sp.]HMR51734.1 hypothetical protein [Amaricoccus sp.]HMT98618.1 hypothetical protein [Amaricoccus sp.]
MSLVEDLHETAPAEQAASARRTLAQRLAQRNRLRAERAERLARLHERPGHIAGPPAAAADDDGAALEDFLRALTGGLRSEAPAVLPPPGAVLPFQRPSTDIPPEASAAPPAAAPAAAAKAPDLDRLPGAGPGLVWALERAGLRCLADLAPLAPEDLAARLGPLGRLVPAASWIAAARRAVAEVSAA